MHKKEKKVKESSVENQVYKVFPNDLNAYGTAFGGMIMSICDRVANVVAERHSGMTCVTAAVDSMHFLLPAGQGDILLFSAAVNKTWNTSMEIGVKVEAEHYSSKERRHILSAYFTFIACDENRKPAPVPAVIPETDVEKIRYREAEDRREKRKVHRAERDRKRKHLPFLKM